MHAFVHNRLSKSIWAANDAAATVAEAVNTSHGLFVFMHVFYFNISVMTVFLPISLLPPIGRAWKGKVLCKNKNHTHTHVCGPTKRECLFQFFASISKDYSPRQWDEVAFFGSRSLMSNATPPLSVSYASRRTFGG